MRRMSPVMFFTLVLVLASLFTFLVPCGPALAADWGQSADGGIAGGYKPISFSIRCQAVFGGKLYAGTFNWNGCEVWRYDGTSWEQVVGQSPAGTVGTGPGFGKAGNNHAYSMAVYNNKLYVGASNTGGCEVWRTSDGTTWKRVDGGSLGATNTEASSMAAFGGDLYVGTYNGGGCEVYRYNGTAWTRVVGPGAVIGAGFGNANNRYASSMAVYNNQLYAGTVNTANGCQVWRTANGSNWLISSGAGFGALANIGVMSMQAYGGSLWAGTRNGGGCEIWSYNGTTWVPWAATGITNSANTAAASMAVYGGNLHVGTENNSNGCQVFSTPGGGVWNRVDGGALGAYNASVSSLAAYGGKLYAATDNLRPGAEVWASAGAGGIPYTDWAKVNVSGFTPNRNYGAYSMASFNGNLYVGTGAPNGCEIWRFDGGSWKQVNSDGFGSVMTESAPSMAVFKGRLYVGTSSRYTGGQIWRTANGSDWTQVDGGVLGKNNFGVSSMAVFDNMLHIGTSNTSTGCQVWRSTDGTVWTRVDNGFFGVDNEEAASLAVYKGGLLVGTSHAGVTGCEVWETRGAGGLPYTDWTRVNVGGFGDTYNEVASSMATYGGRLYVGTKNFSGCQLWSTGADNPSFADWGLVQPVSFGNTDNEEITSMAVWDGKLYAGTRGGITGCEVWAWDGSSWAQEDSDGFGDSTNRGASAMALYFDGLFVGTDNDATGCQVWNTGSTWYLAEGATDGGFETWVLVQNPGTSPVHVDFTLNTDAGKVKPSDLQGLAIPAGSRVSFNMSTWASTFDVSTKVHATDGLVICERAMYGTPAGQSFRELGHDSVGVTSPAPTWYMAEGATDGGFETWVLVQNPGAAAVHVDFTLNTGAGEQKPLDLQGVKIPAGSRSSFNLGKWVTDYDVSTKVACSDGQVICERAMYWTPPGQANRALGHDSVGVTSPAPTWYMAEGATTGGFETWVLVQNPGAAPVHVDFTLNTDVGEVKPVKLQGVEIPAGSRRSFNLGNQVTTFNVSTKVDCTDGKVICERAMYWTPEGQAYRELGHDSVGVTSPSAVWYMAEGATIGGFETWVLVQNPGTSPVRVDFTLNTDAGEKKPPDLRGIEIPAGGRVSFDMGLFEQTLNLSTKVTARNGLIVCERAMYWTPEGQANRELGHDSVGYSP
jgi:hypothetical protein